MSYNPLFSRSDDSTEAALRLSGPNHSARDRDEPAPAPRTPDAAAQGTTPSASNAAPRDGPAHTGAASTSSRTDSSAGGASAEGASGSETDSEGDSEEEALAALGKRMSDALGSKSRPGDVMRLGGHSAAIDRAEEALLKWEPELGSLGKAAKEGQGEVRGVNAQRKALLDRAATGKEGGLNRGAPLVAKGDRKAAREARKAMAETSGKKWFDLPATKIDPEMKTDLRVLRLRGAFDPQRFYKSLDDTKVRLGPGDADPACSEALKCTACDALVSAALHAALSSGEHIW